MLVIKSLSHRLKKQDDGITITKIVGISLKLPNIKTPVKGI
jgi:hypothetical protein